MRGLNRLLYKCSPRPAAQIDETVMSDSFCCALYGSSFGHRKSTLFFAGCLKQNHLVASELLITIFACSFNFGFVFVEKLKLVLIKFANIINRAFSKPQLFRYFQRRQNHHITYPVSLYNSCLVSFLIILYFRQRIVPRVVGINRQ